jgi:DNA polymerase/3'-5' exonuclease PolX
MQLADALELSNQLCARMPYLHITGSVRRKQPVVHDLDYVSTQPLSSVLRDFNQHFTIVAIRAVGDRYISLLVRVQKGQQAVQVDVWHAVDRTDFVFQQFHHTGNQLFNIATRAQAKRLGYLLNEHGLWKNGRRVKGITKERDIFKAIGVRYHRPDERQLPHEHGAK